MIKNKVLTFFLAVGLMLYCGQEAQILAQDPVQDYVAAARGLVQAAQSGLNSAQQLCQSVDCGPEFLTSLSDLGGAINNLSALLGEAYTDVDAIRSAIDGLSPMMQEVCDRLGGACTDSLMRADTGSAPAHTLLVYSDYADCRRGARETRRACLENINWWFNCWQRVPFCDWPGWPFDAGSFHRDCQGFIDRGLPACRCPCPQSERQGGCPQFFQTGRMDECGDCTYESCQRGSDPRCSCSQVGRDPSAWNSVQCDLCRWSNAGLAAADWKRAAICEKNYTQDMYDCRQAY